VICAPPGDMKRQGARAIEVAADWRYIDRVVG
jgi:hypothetical protein